jgi:hypothetical protein
MQAILLLTMSIIFMMITPSVYLLATSIDASPVLPIGRSGN